MSRSEGIGKSPERVYGPVLRCLLGYAVSFGRRTGRSGFDSWRVDGGVNGQMVGKALGKVCQARSAVSDCAMRAYGEESIVGHWPERGPVETMSCGAGRKHGCDE